MNTLKLLALAAFVLLFSQCKSPTEVMQSGQPSVLEALRVLDTVDGKFHELAKLNLSSTPQQVVELTRQWIKNQPNVEDASSLDSTFIDIDMKSGLRTTFKIEFLGPDSLCLTRGGGSKKQNTALIPTRKSKNVITNKKVLIYAPFVGDQIADLYKVGELDSIENILINSGKGFEITVSNGSSIHDIQSFGEYGLVIMDTHGLPDCFYSGISLFPLTQNSDTNQADQKKYFDQVLGPGGYDYIINNSFRFLKEEQIINYNLAISWQTFLKPKETQPEYILLINSKFVNGLLPMPNTIIVGNFCYSGWSKYGKSDNFNVKDPIKTAFTNKQPLSYYSYSYNDGTSGIVDNPFAKKMENSLITAFSVDGDSTGNAYLDSHGKEFIQPGYPLILKHFGADDYSYEGCVDEFTDERDGQIYKAVCIGKQNWMAQNLNYNAPGSITYDNNPANGPIYGRLYDYKTIMQGADSSKANPSGVRGICPKGWHVPSTAEFETLFEAVDFNIAGGALKAKTLWDTPNTGATNSSGFTGLPGGFTSIISASASSLNLGRVAYFATTTNEGGFWSLWNLVYDSSDIQGTSGLFENWGVSCRCLKD